MNVRVWSVVVVALSLVCGSYAQERTAGGSLNMEASWSALQNIADQANNNAKSAHIRLNQVDACARKGAFYATGQAGADGNGCMRGFVITGGGQCLTPESGPRVGTDWTIRNPWGDATGCQNGVPRCGDAKVLHIGYGTDRMSENEMSNFCKYPGSGGVYLNECHTQEFLCTRGM
ncbi:MAG: hypothetical protein DI628_07140 [Blastochloris viridis]|uniref:Uncharacterized protein n=1 Tax=Blastochloris viridis TaxID=1079 RepID=A0A6N4R942_BLAVI|nr:MAG: hypothetical protein DI628_07140 [Blastochloris viridis]